MLAPVVLFVYNRPWHTEQTLFALMNNDLAINSTLFIYADGPKVNATEDDLNKIAQVKEIIKQQQWCKEVIIVESIINKGLANSIIEGVTDLVNQFGKIIVLEDDLVTGKGFLKYMNEALDLYENEHEIIAINAYNFPINTNRLSETFFLKGADCWGWATWKRGWCLFNNDSKALYNEIINKNLNYEFDFFGSYGYTQMLKNQTDGIINSWAIRWYASAFLKNKLSLYPKISLVKNIGLDGSGTHGENDNSLSIKLENYCEVRPIVIKESILAKKRIKSYFKPSDLKRIFNTINKFAN